MTAAINLPLCTGCGLCVNVCPANAVNTTKGKAAVTPRRCLSCGHCAAVCPTGAAVSETGQYKSFRVREPSGTEIERLLKGKRSVREFKDIPVPRDTLKRLVSFAEKAPSSKNTRQRRYIILTNPELITRAEGAVISYFGSLTTPFIPPVLKLISLLSKKNGRMLAASVREFKAMQTSFNNGEHPVFCRAPAVIFITGPKSNMQVKDDCVCAQQYLMLYAESTGLGSCINGYAQFAHKRLEKHLRVPKDRTIQAVIMLGYPRFQYKKEIVYDSPVIRWE